MRKFVVVMALLSVSAFVGACGTDQNPTAARNPELVASSIDKNALNAALLSTDAVWSVTARTGAAELQEVGTLDAVAHAAEQLGTPSGGSAELGQKQPLPGVTWAPAECAQMIEAAVIDYTKVQGFARLWATRTTTDFAAGGVRDGITANAALTTPADNVDFDRVRAKLERCKTATVTLDTFGGAVGTLTAQEISAPEIDGADRVLAWRQTAVFDRLPAEAAGLAALFTAEAVYMTKGDVIIWTQHGGQAPLTAAQLAGPAFKHAMETLSAK